MVVASNATAQDPECGTTGVVSVSGSYESAVIGDRFQLGRPPTLLTRTASVAPIGFTRLKSDRVGSIRAKDVQPENAFAFHVLLRPALVDMWIDGKHAMAASLQPGATFLGNLNQNPVPELHTPFDNLRFYISQATLDELALDRGMRRTEGLVASSLGAHDRVMYGLALALADHVEHASERSALFVDHIALAFHAHVTEAYGNAVAPGQLTLGTLAPWQLRRALDFIRAHLDRDPTIAQLASECGLSSGYFSRAFRRSTGVTPHQWLMRRRIERARELLLAGDRALADIAVVCGFVDQSHFSRVFAKFEGDSPGRWRRMNRTGG
jgi:AraC family transcriptional regulator